MRLPLPFDTDAAPLLRCMRCGREMPVEPIFDHYPVCAGATDEPCLPQVIYRRPFAHCHDDEPPETPLIAPPRLRDRLGLGQLWLKNETVLPTASWKDRVNRVHVELAARWGYSSVAAISTGNHGISLAAQARRAGLNCRVLLHPDCPPFTRQLIGYFGAELTPYEGEPYRQLRDLVRRERIYPAVSLPSMAGLGNPFGAEGYKAIGVEIVRQVTWKQQAWVIVPTGIGDGAFGIDKAFRELADAGLIARRPRVVAVQGAGCAPLVNAWRAGDHQIQPVKDPGGIALSIREPRSGEHALRAVRGSDGLAIAVSDEQIRDAMTLLADEGLLIEPASAATVAAAEELARTACVDPQDAVVCVLSGAGVKWAGADWLAHPVPTIQTLA